ncbi:GIY-YIG nuclease family protein [Gordonia humi]|uniref:GIY-YIG nuclease family protein n=1 Tax=Gordonia humi TaxID=686429 RepID=UPI00360C3ED7
MPSHNDLGYVYVLTSPNCPSVKIGRTNQQPPHRLREINNTSPYKELGPWTIADVVQVYDSVAVETRIHRQIRAHHDSSVSGQNELFRIPLAEALALLRSIPTVDEMYAYPKLERCFYDPRLAAYLDTLYQYAGLPNFVDDQGAWTLTLFTTTSGGRYFTVNIGSHEVAFSSTPRRGEKWTHQLPDGRPPDQRLPRSHTVGPAAWRLCRRRRLCHAA